MCLFNLQCMGLRLSQLLSNPSHKYLRIRSCTSTLLRPHVLSIRGNKAGSKPPSTDSPNTNLKELQDQQHQSSAKRSSFSFAAKQRSKAEDATVRHGVVCDDVDVSALFKET